MAELTVYTAQTIEVPDDDLIWHESPDGKHRWLQTVETAKAAMGDLGDRTITDARRLVTAELRPDPEMQKDYDEVTAEMERELEARRVKLLAGAHPDDLPTEEQIRADWEPVEPDIVLSCCNCGSTTFRYDENRSETCSMKEFDPETSELTFWSDGRGGDGDGSPGVVCDGCDGEVDYPDEVTIEWAG